eukprot:scaffold39576_cov281-Isochrysis_galbana.AAC.1
MAWARELLRVARVAKVADGHVGAAIEARGRNVEAWGAAPRVSLRLARGEGGRWRMATLALLEAGGRDVYRRAERLAARVAAGRGRSHTRSPRAGAG